jgi:hypothetical protein
MSENVASAIYSICCLLVVVVICGSVLYGCSRESDTYYKAQSECVNQGGSWVPTGSGGSYQASCVFGKSK